MSEMALTADHLIVIGRGKLIADTSVADFVARRVGNSSFACARRRLDELRGAARGARHRVDGVEPGLLEVHGLTAEQIGEPAAAARIVAP